MGQSKQPLDPYPYPRDPRSAPLLPGVDDGLYVYAQDLDGIVYGLPDGGHLHPKILGGAKPVQYAGDLRLEGQKILDMTNLSGTFQFDDPQGLREVAVALIAVGFIIEAGAVRFFPVDGSSPLILE